MQHKNIDFYANVLPVILAGGQGRRLWPLSRPAHPKPFLKPFGRVSLLQQTLRRVQQFSDIWVVGHKDHKDLIFRHADGVGARLSCILCEPLAKNTGPAIIAAAFCAKKADKKYLMFLPSDHNIRYEGRIWAAAQSALDQADHDIVVFGIRPSCPATRYGYIHVGDTLEGAQNVHKVSAFTEKPDKKTAKLFLQDGSYLWNGGMFFCRPDVLINAAQKYAPEMYKACKEASENAVQDDLFLELAEDHFARSPKQSIDYALIERTKNLSVVPVDLEWTDIGTWPSLIKAMLQKMLVKRDCNLMAEQHNSKL